MTVHRVRIWHSVAGSEDFNGWLASWVSTMEPWSDPEVENGTTNLLSDSGGAGYYQGELAFEWSESRSNILNSLEQNAQSRCDWYRMGYHECNHDDGSDRCSWDEVRENGSVPDRIPDISV